MGPREQFLAATDAMNRRDIPALKELTHPDLVFHPIRAEVAGDYLGHDGIESFMADTAETFDLFHIEYEELRELDDGRLYAHGRVRTRGRAGHVDTVVVTAGIATFRDGLVASWTDYADRAAARAAAGIDAD